MSAILIGEAPTAEQKRRMSNDLRQALDGIPAAELRSWTLVIPADFVFLAFRRCKNLSSLVVRSGKFIGRESSAAIRATLDGALQDHLRARGMAAKDSTVGTGKEIQAMAKKLCEGVKSTRTEDLPHVAVSVLGFCMGSGGLDGDGGVPDLDFLGGIGEHRSFMTHSIISAAVIEALLLSVARLTRLVHTRLPSGHDPLWDELLTHSDTALSRLSAGFSLGIGYHLGVDATLDGDGTYKSLPMELPLFGHQLIAATNSLTEIYRTLDDKLAHQFDHYLQSIGSGERIPEKVNDLGRRAAQGAAELSAVLKVAGSGVMAGLRAAVEDRKRKPQ